VLIKTVFVQVTCKRPWEFLQFTM